MFNAIKRKIEKIERLDQDKIMTEILDDSKIQSDIIALNQKQLFEEGVQADGTPTGEYQPATIQGTKYYPGKIEKGQPYDHVTLKDTGAFYNSMKVESN